MVSQLHEMDASCVSPYFHTSPRLQTWLVKADLLLSLLIGLALLSLHRLSANGNPVPALLFQEYPSVFDAFVISIIFSFTASFSWLFMGNNPKPATFRKIYFILSMLFMASALSILAFALFLEYLRLVHPASRWWNPENFSLFSQGSRFWNPENFRLVFRN